MDEIRTRFKLTNATDKILALRGQLDPKQVRTYEAEAVVDTGAIRSVIPLQVMQQLGAQAYSQRMAELADGFASGGADGTDLLRLARPRN
jgi:predicted aspartyl protease